MDTIILGLAVVSALTVLSINVVDIDLAVSVFVARRYHFDLRVRGSRVGYLQVFYPAAHIIFRIAEVLWRISMLVAFAAVTAFQLGVLGVLLTALVCTAEYLCMLIILKRHSPKDEACGVHFIVAAFLVVADVTRFVDRPGFCYPARRISRAVDRWRKVQFLLLAGFVTCLRLSIPPSRTKTFVERVHALTLMIVLLSSLTVSELLKLTPMIKSVGDDLHTAVLHHKISRVRKLLDTSLGGEALDVNGPTKDSEKITAAMLAAENGFVEALRMIMACGGKVEVRSARKETCLHYAVRAKQLEALELLVNQPGAQQLLRQVHGELRSCATKALGLTEDPGEVFSSSEAQRLFLLLEPNRGTRRRVEENSSTVSLQNVRTHLAVSRTLLKFFPNAVEEDAASLIRWGAVPELHELHSVSALVLAHAAGPLGRFLLPRLGAEGEKGEAVGCEWQAAVASLKSMRKVRALGQGVAGAAVPQFIEYLPAYTWRCGHPFIVRLEQAFQTPHYYALLLELCPNGDLNQLLCSTQDETGRCAGLPVARAAKYAGQVLLALVHIHEALGIIYRDVKPENMLLSASDEAKLADFGLALYVGSKAFSAHCIPIAGTPRFLAPELVMGEEEDEGDPPGVPDVRFDPFKTDAYSFGVTLQVMLLGEDCADLEEGDGCLWILPRRLPDQEQAQLLHNACEGSRLMPEAVDLLLKLLPSKPRFRSRLADKRIKKHPFFLTALGCQDLEERLLKAQ
ncbi:unnamed protein product [Effrenium voratum]|nr:unnamed protein product [Effrenium voratum]